MIDRSIDRSQLQKDRVRLVGRYKTVKTIHFQRNSDIFQAEKYCNCIYRLFRFTERTQYHSNQRAQALLFRDFFLVLSSINNLQCLMPTTVGSSDGVNGEAVFSIACSCWERLREVPNYFRLDNFKLYEVNFQRWVNWSTLSRVGCCRKILQMITLEAMLRQRDF